MPEYLYRFRSIKSLINYAELADTYIFFPSPEKLNDPLEGYREVIWSGDEVVWENLFKHYFLVLMKRATMYIFSQDLSDANFPIHASLEDVQGETFPALKNAVDVFLNTPQIVEHIQLLADGRREVAEEELRFHLRSIHMYALKLVTQLLVDLKMLGGEQMISDVSDEDALKMSSLIVEYSRGLSIFSGAETKEFIRLGLASIESNLLLSSYEEWKSERPLNWARLSTFFADDYVRNIKGLCNQKWYVACFMKTPYSSSIWGTYGENHSAVCLKFKVNSQDGRPVLNLESSHAGPNKKITLPLEKVNYNAKPPRLPFFTSIACYSAKKLTSDWYLNALGTLSPLSSEVLDNNDEWRQRYWDDHRESITTKLQAWAGEDEYRAPLHSALDSYNEDDSRKLKYDFSCLDGIIFGIKTSEENKFKLIDVVKELCDKTGRSDFKFYQAYHDTNESKISYRHILTISASPKE